MKSIPIVLLFLLSALSIEAQYQINNVYLDQRKVFEKSDPDWFFLSPLLNWIHYETRPYVIKDELLFAPGEELNMELIEETERNLREIDLFTDVRIELDSVNPDSYDLYVIAKDRWSTFGSILFGSGGGKTEYGLRVEEQNLLGTGSSISLEGLHRTEYDIRGQVIFDGTYRRMFRSEISADFLLMAHRFRTEQELAIYKPFRTLDTRYSFGANAVNQFGDDFIFMQKDSIQRVENEIRSLDVFFSRAWWREDRIFISGGLFMQEAKRPAPIFKRAYDNSGGVLVQFSSVTQDFKELQGIDSYNVVDASIGGYGSATLGRIFSMGEGGEHLYYVGGEGETSYYDGKLYLFGKLKASTSFDMGNAKFTYQEFFGKSFYKFSQHIVVGAQFRQQTAWNWPADRQLILDNDAGLRGYDANVYEGDNRIVGNFELRWMPRYNVFFFDLSAVAFYDIGAVWNTDSEIFKSQFKNAVGAGLRFHFTKSNSSKHVFRLDFAYNLESKKVGVIFTTSQMFSFFENHVFKRPEIFGLEFNKE